jgi:hypothetical protein
VAQQKLRFQFGLRAVLLLTLLCCLAARLDPMNWRRAADRPKPLAPVPPGRVAQVDVIEVNYQQAWRSRQIIFWSQHPDGELHIREWRLLKSPSMFPARLDDQWVCIWAEGGIAKCVQAPAFRHTYGSSDPEIADRSTIAKKDRVPLWTRP